MEREIGFRNKTMDLAKEVVIGRLTGLIRDNDCVRYKIRGRENIDSVRELILSGKIIIAVLDHRSYADMITGSIVAIRENFDDLVRSAYAILRISYLEKFPTNLLSQYFRVWPVVPHTIPNYAGREEINQRAIEMAQNLPGGSILAIAPEGTRSGQVSMQEARFGAERFWHGQGERFVLPIAIERTEKQWPRGNLITTGFYYAFICRFFGSKFIFGEPIAVSEVDRMARRLAETDEDFVRLKTDVVMAEIARLHIEYGDPRYAGVYTDLAIQIQALRSAA